MNAPLNWNSRRLTQGWQRGINAFYYGLGLTDADLERAQIGIGVPLLGVLLAYLMFLGHQLDASRFSNPGLKEFLFSGWRIDSLYHNLWVRPFTALGRWWRNEPVDQLYNAVVVACQWGHRNLARRGMQGERWARL